MLKQKIEVNESLNVSIGDLLNLKKSMMSLTIRPIMPSEYPVLEDFLYHAIFLPPGTEPLPREVIFKPEIFIYIENFGGANDCGVVAELDGQIVGAAWTRIIPAYGHIDDKTPELAISVLPKYRGQNIGTMLMTRLFELLRERGYKRTSLSVQQKNAAVSFYQRLGYEAMNKNDEDFIMVKELQLAIRPLKADDIIPAMDLVWRVFSVFEAPEYSEEGIAEFKAFIEPSFITDKMSNGEYRLWGAYENEQIVGVIAIKLPLHITLLFVDKHYHRRGIARKLFETVIGDETIIRGHDRVAVYSSPYAVEIYRRMGFVPTDTEQIVNGLRFTPMEHVLQKNKARAANTYEINA